MKPVWWLALFVVATFSLYEQGVYKISCSRTRLRGIQTELEEKIAAAEIKREELQREINSQSDPAWIELTLMRILGLVPEGYTKVYIQEESLFSR